MKGHIAQRYGELVKDLWSGSSKTLAPLKLRVGICVLYIVKIYLKIFSSYGLVCLYCLKPRTVVCLLELLSVCMYLIKVFYVLY